MAVASMYLLRSIVVSFQWGLLFKSFCDLDHIRLGKLGHRGGFKLSFGIDFVVLYFVGDDDAGLLIWFRKSFLGNNLGSNIYELFGLWVQK